MPQPKKIQRPKLDAVIRHIKSGSYDDEIGQLSGAIADRQRTRQEALLGQVKQVFGDEYIVAPKIDKKNPFLETAKRAREIAEGIPVGEAEWAEAARQAEAEEAALRDQLGDATEGGNDPDIESRSPQIGSVE